MLTSKSEVLAYPLYPCLKFHKNSNAVVLFNAKYVGTAVVGNADIPLGYYSTCWTEDDFIRKSGDVIIHQEL